MNFETCPTIPEAIMERTKHSLYGYFSPSEEYFQSIIDWQKNRGDRICFLKHVLMVRLASDQTHF